MRNNNGNIKINDKKVRFVRFGDLNQKKTNKSKKEITYHYPPCKFGIYAFPEFLIEDFLVMWKYTIDKGKPYCSNMYKIKNQMESDGDYDFNIWDEMSRHEVKCMWRDRKILEYEGCVWHHFTNLSKSKVRTDYWAKDTYRDYCIILKKALHNYKKERYNKGFINTNIEITPLAYVRKVYVKDEFEVYLSDKIK